MAEGTSFVLAEYIDYLFFNFLQTGLWPQLNADSAISTGLLQTDYAKVLYSPQDLMKRRSFMQKGTTYPLLSFWRNSYQMVTEGFYGRSVLNRTFTWTDNDNAIHTTSGRFVDFEFSYTIYAEAYFLDFANRFASDMTDLNFIRYFPFTFTGYIDTYTTRLEFTLENFQKTDSVREDTGSRSFQNAATFKVRLSIPLIKEGHFLEQVNIFLNGNQIATIPHA